MNTVNNARSTASKQNIKNAYIKILESKEPELITVSDICKLSKVNRTTFYNHFAGQGELLETLEKEMFLDALDHIQAGATNATELVGCNSMLQILKFIKPKFTIYKAYFSQLSESKLVDELAEFVKKTYITPSLMRNNSYKVYEYDYQYEFCKAGTLAIIKKWLSTDCKESEESVAKLMEKMLIRCLE